MPMKDVPLRSTSDLIGIFEWKGTTVKLCFVQLRELNEECVSQSCVALQDPKPRAIYEGIIY